MSKVFFDTNILVYSFDAMNEKKRDASRELIKQARDLRNGVLSTQVMQEFYVTVTNKLGMDPLVAKDFLASLHDFETISINPMLIQEAIGCQILSRISFWDALILVAAESARCEKVWTEDLNSGQVIRGVRVENPLKGR